MVATICKYMYIDSRFETDAYPQKGTCKAKVSLRAGYPGQIDKPFDNLEKFFKF